MASNDTISALFQLSRPASQGGTESGFVLTQQELTSETGFAIPGAEPLIERIFEEARPREIQLLLEKYGPFDQYSVGEVVAQLTYKIFISVWTGNERPPGEFDLIRQMELDIVGRSEVASAQEFLLWRDPQSGNEYQIGKIHEGANEQPLDQLTLHLLNQSLTGDPTETRVSDLMHQLLEQARAAEADLYSRGAALQFGYGVTVLQEGFELVLHDNEVQNMQTEYRQQYGSRQNLNWLLILGIAVTAILLIVVAVIFARGSSGNRPSVPDYERIR